MENGKWEGEMDMPDGGWDMVIVIQLIMTLIRHSLAVFGQSKVIGP